MLGVGGWEEEHTSIRVPPQMKALQRPRQIIQESPGDRMYATQCKDQAALRRRLFRIKLYNHFRCFLIFSGFNNSGACALHFFLNVCALGTCSGHSSCSQENRSKGFFYQFSSSLCAFLVKILQWLELVFSEFPLQRTYNTTSELKSSNDFVTHLLEKCNERSTRINIHVCRWVLLFA